MSDFWQIPSPAWHSPKDDGTAGRRQILSPAEEKPLVRAIDKISEYAVDKQLTLAEVYDYLRTSMVHAGMKKYPHRENQATRQLPVALGIHRNTVSRIKKAAAE